MSTYCKIWPPYSLLLIVVLSLSSLQNIAQDYELRGAPFNSKDADFSAVYSGNEIIFCSTRSRKQVSFSEDSLATFSTDLYSVQTEPNGSYGSAEPLKGKVNTLLNEGQATFSSDGTAMYYTANLKQATSSKGKKTQEYMLGLYKATKINGEWLPQEPFPYNSAQGKYSVAHPCLSFDNQTLYFSSNMPGGKGGSDIYRCRLINGVWSDPENIEGDINTEGNEFFPFINSNETIYFSSDARSDSEGMDIYFSENNNGNYTEVTRLNQTINTEYDDFAYTELNGQNKGLLSSNRNNDEDHIFLFNKYSQDFDDCLENGYRQLCYNLKDLNLSELIDLPLTYKWEMGDGTTLSGKEVQYCYKKSGNYHVTLSVIDTLTQVEFPAVSETDILINPRSLPYIASADTVYTEKSFEFMVELNEFVEFEIEEIKWETSDGKKFKGPTGTLSLSTVGLYQLKCFITGQKKSNGITPKLCVYKDIYITDDEKLIEDTEPITCCRPDQVVVVFMKPNESEAVRDTTKLDYKLVLFKSDTALSLDNALFKNVKRKVIEYREPESFVYCVDQASTWSELVPQYREIKKLGIEDISVIQIPKETKILELTPESNMKQNDTQAPSNPTHDLMNNNLKNNSIDQFASSNEKGETIDNKEKLEINESKELHALSSKIIPSEAMNIGDYSVLLAESENRIHGPDSGFDKIQDEVTEVFGEGKYQYFISAGADIASAERKIKTAKDAGFLSARLIKLRTKSSNIVNNKVESITKVEQTESKTFYQVRTVSTKERIPLNNPVFKNLLTSITEIQQDDLYSYVIMNTEKKNAALELLKQQTINGNLALVLDSSNLEDFTSKIVKSGKYIAPKNADKLNIEFAKLSDIKFEYNSDEILEQSYLTLNYLAAMLQLEEDFSLKINAHTCSIGGVSYNQMLSEKRAQAVVKYLRKKGIKESKLISKGHGFRNPVSSNMTERGRAANRRVEFIIVFEIKNSQDHE